MYRYTECGLDDVVLVGMDPVREEDGEAVVAIPAVGRLHRTISEAVVARSSKMGGKELRFLRAEMGLTQAGLARTLGVTTLTLGRWERGEVAIGGCAETVMRLLADEVLGLGLGLGVAEVSEKRAAPASGAPIMIDASDPGNYRLAA